jgi:type I restriction-modification system DNA methylase subunit
MSMNKQPIIFATNDDLKNYIHDIHNFLRNNGVGYGIVSLNIFSVFYGLKLIQPKLDVLDLSEKEKQILDYNELVLRTKQNKELIGYIDTEILELLYEMKRKWELQPAKKNKNADLAGFLFHQIPLDVRDEVWRELILKIDKIPVGYNKNTKVNLSGKVYEYFIGRDKNAISELGAFFTDRHIVEFIYDKLKPTLDDNNNVKTMIDPFGGSGGFTLGYAHYLNELFHNEIDWNDNVNNIFHFDMQTDVVNMTGIEMFAITGVMPKRIYNYERTNSFTYEFKRGTSNEQKFMLAIN